jgi:hypothetical protein
MGSLPGQSGYLDDLWELHVPSANWTRLGKPGPRPTSRSGHSMIALSRSRVIVFGGYQWLGGYQGYTPAGSYAGDDLWELNVPTANWTLLQRSEQLVGPNRPSVRFGHSMVALNSTRVFMFGGNKYVHGVTQVEYVRICSPTLAGCHSWCVCMCVCVCVERESESKDRHSV